MYQRPRRNRRTPSIRSLTQETTLYPQDLVAPFFLISGNNQQIPVTSMPGIDRLSIDLILKQAEQLHRAGIPAIALFPVISAHEKDPQGSAALKQTGLIPQAVSLLKKEIPSLCIITDLALDPFTSHGHDGLINAKGEILNDPTIDILSQMALLHAEAGADLVAPSVMMDGRVKAIRNKLDAHEYSHTGILSYTAKYASSLYAPYRDALQSAPAFGDKKTYQMNPANAREALWEAALDTEEGADMLMVKPALFYLDIIAKIRAHSHLPVCAYHVSGEYAMVMAAHERGFCDATAVFLEALLSIKRAGADFIISYAISQILSHLK